VRRGGCSKRDGQERRAQGTRESERQAVVFKGVSGGGG
jgi:hypothetical protein